MSLARMIGRRKLEAFRHAATQSIMRLSSVDTSRMSASDNRRIVLGMSRVVHPVYRSVVKKRKLMLTHSSNLSSQEAAKHPTVSGRRSMWLALDRGYRKTAGGQSRSGADRWQAGDQQDAANASNSLYDASGLLRRRHRRTGRVRTLWSRCACLHAFHVADSTVCRRHGAPATGIGIGSRRGASIYD